MSPLTVVYDSTRADQIPANAQGAAGYVGPFGPDNHFVDFLAIVARFPSLARRGRVVSIAAQAHLTAEYLDVESGDARPDEFPEWFTRMRARGIARPGAYGSRNTWGMHGGLWDVITRAKLLNDCRKWVADVTGIPHIPPGFDGCQYTFHAVPGKDDDGSLVRDSFFRAETSPDPHGLFRTLLVFDSANGRWGNHPQPGNVTPGGPSRYASVEVQVDPSRGHWRDHPMPWNAPPLGGPK